MTEDIDFYDHDDDDTCWNCFGEGVIYDCFEEYACIDPEGGCDLCMYRCDVCRPRPRQASPELRQVLADALAQGTEAGTDETACGLGPKGDGPVAESDAPLLGAQKEKEG